MKALIPMIGNYVAPRFDLALEVIVVVIEKGEVVQERPIVLPKASAEDVCHLVVVEKIDAVVCCAIEEEYYQYLTWKKVRVIDSVVGSYDKIVATLAQESLEAGALLW
jgi:predicted Fe-Mo cluster-binding NifX family protein